jgi:hypothetical protein
MTYRGTLNGLKTFNNQRRAGVELDFLVDGEVLSVPSLPFIMIRLDKPHAKIDKEGWRFKVGNIDYFIPASEMAKALQPYIKADKYKHLERFYDVWQNKEI